MKKSFYVFAFLLGMALVGCQKPEANESPEITETSVELQSASVCFSAKVNFAGNATMTLELATLQDMSDKKEYAMTSVDESLFSVNVVDMEPFIDYFYRMVVSNANFTETTPVKRFSISSDMLSYGDDRFKSRIGASNGGTYNWAVMFPPSVLQPYKGAHVSKIRFRAGELGQYTIKIYTGGTTAPNSLLKSQNHVVTQIGWQEIELYPVSFSSTQPLWVAISCTHEAGEYPAGGGYGIDNPNSRWSKINNGSWGDAAEGINEDITWLIRAYVNYVGTESKGQVIELPQTPTPEEEGNCLSEYEKL